MATTLLASPHVIAAAAGHAQADVEHLLYVLLRLIDLRKALAAHAVFPDDAMAVVDQLLDERPALEDVVIPPRSPRLQTVHDLALRWGGSAADVITSVAAALPRELAFLRKPLEAAARDVAGLYDGALSAANGAMTFQAWDPELRAVMGRMQGLVDTRWPSWTMAPLTLLLSLLCTKTYYAPLQERGIDVVALIGKIGEAMPAPRWERAVPKGHVAAISPALYAAILRAEHYAADDASDVRLRHVLAALHDETELAPWVNRLAGAAA